MSAVTTAPTGDARLLVKICGVTTAEDALGCAAAGADALGLNLWPGSPRFLPEANRAALREALESAHPRVLRVGVFVNAPAAEIAAALGSGLIHVAQLHGDEEPAAGAALAGRAWKALRLGGEGDLPQLQRYPAAHFPLLVIDAPTPAYGGSGRRIDEALAARAAALRPLLLAGGLGPDSVAGAVRRVRPAGVDVASGVESAPGRKDLGKVAAFIAAARAADAAARREDVSDAGGPPRDPASTPWSPT